MSERTAASVLTTATSALESNIKESPVPCAAVHGRVGYHKTLSAIANKHARILWAILAHGDQYNPDALETVCEHHRLGNRASTETREKIELEVGPSAMKPWLTIRQRMPASTDHQRRRLTKIE